MADWAMLLPWVASVLRRASRMTGAGLRLAGPPRMHLARQHQDRHGLRTGPAEGRPGDRLPAGRPRQSRRAHARAGPGRTIGQDAATRMASGRNAGYVRGQRGGGDPTEQSEQTGPDRRHVPPRGFGDPHAAKRSMIMTTTVLRKCIRDGRIAQVHDAALDALSPQRRS